MGTIYRFTHQPRETKVYLAVVIITAAVSIIQFVVDKSTEDGSEPVASALALYLPMAWDGEFWRILSVSLVHGGLLHLLMNVWFIYAIGRLYEQFTGPIGFGAVYLASIVGGSVAILLFGDLLVPTVGASGGAYGLMGGLIAAMYVNTGSISGIWATSFGRQILVVLALNLIISLAPGISLLGHVGGLVVGGMAGYVVERLRQGKASPADKLAGVLLLLALAGAVAYSLRPMYRGAWRLYESALLVDKIQDLSEQDPNSPEIQSASDRVLEYQRQGFQDYDTSERYVSFRAKVDQRIGAVSDWLNARRGPKARPPDPETGGNPPGGTATPGD